MTREKVVGREGGPETPAEWVERTCQEHGVPVKVTDPECLAPTLAP